jgi:hypothetical protein
VKNVHVQVVGPIQPSGSRGDVLRHPGEVLSLFPYNSFNPSQRVVLERIHASHTSFFFLHFPRFDHSFIEHPIFATKTTLQAGVRTPLPLAGLLKDIDIRP